MVLPLFAHWSIIICAVFFGFLTGCSNTLLQSRRVATPFAPDIESDCKILRTQVLKLRTDMRSGTEERSCKTTLADLSIQENAKNIKSVSTPKEKMDIMLSAQLFETAQAAWEFVKIIDKKDVIAISCTDIENTFSPGIGTGIAYADFHRTGEHYTTHLVCEDDKLLMVFPPNKESLDEYDRETVLSLIGKASETAVEHGVKGAIR